jgi:transposase-like protein
VGFRFPAEVIVVAVRRYLRHGLSYRDVEELLVERGPEVDHATVFRRVQRFTPPLIDAARFGRHSPGDRWFVDETYVKINGVAAVRLPRRRPVRTGHRRSRLGPPRHPGCPAGSPNGP